MTSLSKLVVCSIAIRSLDHLAMVLKVVAFCLAQIKDLTFDLLKPDVPCLCKQCKSRSVGFWICTVCYYVNSYQESGSSNPIG